MDRVRIITSDRRFFVAASAMVWLAACGGWTGPVVDPGAVASDSINGDTTTPTGPTEPSVTTTPKSIEGTGTFDTEQPDGENEGGFGAPAAAPGEFDDASPIPITAVAALDDTGCWYLTGGSSRSLLVAPVGTVLDDSGSALVTPPVTSSLTVTTSTLAAGTKQ